MERVYSYNPGTRTKDKVTLKFGFIHCLILSNSSNAEFNMGQKIKLQFQTEVILNNPVLN